MSSKVLVLVLSSGKTLISEEKEAISEYKHNYFPTAKPKFSISSLIFFRRKQPSALCLSGALSFSGFSRPPHSAGPSQSLPPQAVSTRPRCCPTCSALRLLRCRLCWKPPFPAGNGFYSGHGDSPSATKGTFEQPRSSVGWGRTRPQPQVLNPAPSPPFSRHMFLSSAHSTTSASSSSPTSHPAMVPGTLEPAQRHPPTQAQMLLLTPHGYPSTSISLPRPRIFLSADQALLQQRAPQPGSFCTLTLVLPLVLASPPPRMHPIQACNELILVPTQPKNTAASITPPPSSSQAHREIPQ